MAVSIVGNIRCEETCFIISYDVTIIACFVGVCICWITKSFTNWAFLTSISCGSKCKPRCTAIAFFSSIATEEIFTYLASREGRAEFRTSLTLWITFSRKKHKGAYSPLGSTWIRYSGNEFDFDLSWISII